MSRKILALDFGSTGVKITLFDESANIVGSKYREYKTYYPQPNYVLQSPAEWWKCFCDATKELFAASGVNPGEVACVAPSAQMSTAIPIDKNGNVLVDPCWIWADMRSTEQVERITSEFGGKEKFYGITGGGMNEETYTGFKIAWIKEKMPDLYNNTYKFLQVKEFIGWRLTGCMATDFSDASECAMMDIKRKDWSDDILKSIGVSLDKLLPIKRSYDLLGTITKEAALETGLIEGTPVCVGGGDVSIASAGAGIAGEGESYIYIGSGAWMGVYSNQPIFDYKTRMVNLCDISGEGYLPHLLGYCGGIAHRWVRDLINNAEGLEGQMNYDKIDSYLSKSPAGSKGLMFMPFLRGGGAPYNNLNARGCFLGIDLSHNYYDMCRSIMEGTAYVLREMLETLEAFSGKQMHKVILIGGGSKCDEWRQIIANVFQRPISCTTMKQEANSWGAAICGGVCAGLWKDVKAAQSLVKVVSVNEPDKQMAGVYNKLYETFKSSYKCLVPAFDDLAGARSLLTDLNLV